MQFITLLVASIALFGALIEAFPQSAHFQRLPYYPPPTAAPRPIRVRRQVLGGQISTNPAGGNDARVDLTHGIGTPDRNIIGQVFAAGNTNGGPVATGATLSANSNGLGASVSKQHIPDVRDTLTKSISADLFNDGANKVAVNAFKSDNINLANSFKYEHNGQGITYSNINGHEASLTQSSIPNFGRQLELAAKTNLWSSQDHNTRLDFSALASKWTSGPFSSQKDFEANLGLTHIFG